MSDDLIWEIGILCGFPLGLVILGELSERLERQGNPLAKGIRQVRHIVLPALGVLLIMQKVLDVSPDGAAIRLVETLFWLTVIYAGMTLLGNLMHVAELRPSALVAKIPAIFFGLSRAVVIFWVLYYVLGELWGVPLKTAGAALGVGSVGIAFALQDTLSNLVSGFLLIASSPFKVGDWIMVNDKWCEVLNINWRTTQLRRIDHVLLVVPNGVLAKEAVENYGAKDSNYR